MLFILFSCFFNNIFIISVVKVNIKVRLVLITPAGIPITFVKEIILVPPVVADKKSKFYQHNQEQQRIYSIF